jgi:hypothetical protein
VSGLLLVAVALAAEPVVERGNDSVIEGRIDLSVPADKVFAVVSDPEAVSRIDGTSKVTAKPDGDCLLVHTEVDHPIARAIFDTRSCPDGPLAVAQTLTHSEQMQEYASRWWVEEREGGSRLHYRIRTVASLPVPQFIVDRTTVKSTERLLGRLRDHLEAAPSE